MISVIIVEDNKIIRESLAALIQGTDGFVCTAVYGDCETMFKDKEVGKADVVLMDIGLPGMNGIEGVRLIKEKYPDTDVLMLTVYEDNQKVFDALCAGACGYLLKKTPPAQLLDAIKDVFNGGSPMSSLVARKVVSIFQQGITKKEKAGAVLTERETEVLAALANGKSYKEIGDVLFISVDTVRQHIKNIYEKLHVHTQSAAVAQGIRKGLI